MCTEYSHCKNDYLKKQNLRKIEMKVCLRAKQFRKWSYALKIQNKTILDAEIILANAKTVIVNVVTYNFYFTLL